MILSKFSETIIKGLEKGEKRGIIKGLKKKAIFLDIKFKFGSSKAKQIRNLSFSSSSFSTDHKKLAQKQE